MTPEGRQQLEGLAVYWERLATLGTLSGDESGRLRQCAEELRDRLALLLAEAHPQVEETKEENDPRVDHTQYDPPSAEPLATASTNETTPTDDDGLGLSIDMLDVDRLRQWADNLLVYGADVSQWGDCIFVAGKMQQIATGVEKAVRDIGLLRARVVTPNPRHEALINRATEYLANGGLFNPELANHDEVSLLIRDMRDALSSDASRTAAPDVAEGARPMTPNQKRNQWLLDDVGGLDDVVVDEPATFRLERMAHDHVWGAVYHRDGSRTTFDVLGDRLALMYEHEPASPAPAPVTPTEDQT